MVASALKRYAFISAKFKTRLSKLLTRDFFERLMRAHNLSDALHLLRDTEYSALTEIYQKTGDLKTVELALVRKEIDMYRGTLKHLDEQLESFVSTLLLRYEIDSVKSLLRLWFDRVVRGRPVGTAAGYMLRERIVHDIAVDAIINAGSMEEVILAFSGTPYERIVADKSGQVLEQKTLFSLEMELDRFFYSQLLSAASLLDQRDSEIALRLLGIEIDMENLNRLIRFKTFYSISPKEVYELLIPGGNSIGTVEASEAFAKEDAASMMTSLVTAGYPGWESFVSSGTGDSYSRYLLFEQIFRQIYEKELARIKGGNPFTIGILLVYFFLKRRESQKILTLLNAKMYSLEEERIQDAL